VTPPAARPAAAAAPIIAVALLTAAYILYFGTYSLLEYWSFRMHALDMGNMGQAAWNTLHGHPFYFTNMRLPYGIEAWGTTTRLSFHVEALFPVIALVYLVYGRPESLLILQTLTIASGGIAVYLLARDVLERPWLGVAFAAAYFLHPSLEALNLYEFHPVSLATPLLLWGFWFAWRRRYLPFVLCCLAAMGTKEQIGLVVAMLALYVAVVNRERLVGLFLAAAGIAWSLLAALVIEKHYRAPGTVSYLHSRYGYLGHGVHGVLDTLLHHPGTITGVIVTWAKLGFLLHLLLPAGFLSLLSPLALLIAAPTLVLNLASQSASMYSALGDNSAELVAVVMIAGVLGARRLLIRLRSRLTARLAASLLGIYLLIAALAAQYDDGFTPIGPRFSFPSIGAHQKLQNRFVSMIPGGAPVSTQDQLDPHLADRRYLYLFQDMGGLPFPGAPGSAATPPADWILLDVSSPTYPLPSFELHDRAVSDLRRRGWGVRSANDGLILLQHGVSSKHIPPAFYSYMSEPTTAIQHRLSGSEHGLHVVGYSVTQTDLTNHRVPSEAYTIYLRATRRLSRNYQPVIFTRLGSATECSGNTLGLDWLPTVRWQPGKVYAVRFQPIETFADSPGTKRFYLALMLSAPVERRLANPPYSCTALWAAKTRLWPIGLLHAGV
jgi:uncharacterized membrane protein